MTQYYNVTTNLGDAEIANAIATNTKLEVTHIVFGDGNGSVPTPTKSRASLVREVHRQAITKYERHPTNTNWIIIETIIPSNVGGFTIREMGIFANGKLISHGSHAPFEKIADPSGVSEYRLKFTQNIRDGDVVEITLDESLIYASQAWVEENFIKRSEIVDNLKTSDATKPVSAKQAKELQDNKVGKTDYATSTTAGVVKVGNNLTILDGVLSAVAPDDYTLPNATKSVKGGVIVGNNISVSNGTISVATATATTAGVTKVNDTLASTSTTDAVSANQARILNETKNSVSVLSGVIASGGTIPLPSGYTEAQCKWIISIGTGQTNPHQSNNVGNDTWFQECFTTGRVVTARVRMINTSVTQPVWKDVVANYIIIGVK